MKALIFIIEKQIEKLKKFLSWLSPKKERKFRLFAKKINNVDRYYLYGKDGKEKYLPMEESDLIMKYARCELDDKLREQCNKTIAALEKCLKILSSCKTPEEVYEGIRPAKKEVFGKVIPIVDVQLWYDKKPAYKKKGFRYNDPIIKAINGIRVRSKSEGMIVGVFVELDIPFIYEYPVYVDNLAIYPDFHVLNKRTGEEFIYEHFGSMDNADYVENQFKWKLEQYEKIGITFGHGLVATFETKLTPLNEDYLRDFVKKHFL